MAMPKQTKKTSGPTTQEVPPPTSKSKRRSKGGQVPKPADMRDADVANGENPDT